MKTQSAKAKGRTLQQLVRDKILLLFPTLTARDVKSTSMGASGEDILLSTAAHAVVPFYIEAKSRAKLAVYKFFEQSKTDQNVLLVVKENRKKPLAVVDLDLFLSLLKEIDDLKKNTKTK
jgi:hypothetical protein